MTVNMNSKVKRRRKQAMFAAQNGKCYWCGCAMNFEIEHCRKLTYATFEHIRPKHMGGRDCANNLVLSCRRCNTERAGSVWAPQQNEAHP